MQEWAVNYWIQKGAPPEKINLGMPLYGRTFTLANPSNNGLFAPDSGNGGVVGRYTGESGILAYYEVKLPLITIFPFKIAISIEVF